MADKKYIDMKDSELVEYFLFPDFQSTTNGNEISLQLVDETLENINKVAKKLSINYIWHNDGFQIAPKNVVPLIHSNTNDSEAFSFYGSMNYGENIEDEWFLVYILLELTKQIDGLVVRVKDGDGEFLLIEAADCLPAWANPDTCEDKVFLFEGSLHILPKKLKVNGVTDDIIKYLKQNTDKTKASTNVQDAIQKKISGFPEKIDKSFHNATLYLPVAVAALLNSQPGLIAPAVRAFAERDLIDVKACRAMKYFPPENRVLTRVTFTRCLYAMMVSSKFIPDRRTGWNLPSPNDELYKSHLLGVKAACGFEILLSQIRSRKDKDDVETIDFENDPNWKKFVKSLTSKNYFRGLLEHSQDHNKLLESAKDFYKTSCEKSVKPNKGKEISDLLEGLEVDVDDLKRREKELGSPDDDSWMNITQHDLDAMLEARFGSVGHDVQMPNGNEDISNHLKTFINHVSGLEGAEFPKKESKPTPPVRPKRGVKNKKRKSVKFSPDTKLHSASSSDRLPNTNANKINFEADGFINAIQNILDFSIPDDNYWESEGSGMSSYEDEMDLDLGESKGGARGGEQGGSETKRDGDLLRYMDEMDRELEGSTLGKSFVKKPGVKEMKANKEADDSFDDIEAFQPVDIDMNALKNILSSYQAQMGDAGPAENLLGPLGVNLDDIDADVD